jgi:hypothetical protein
LVSGGCRDELGKHSGRVDGDELSRASRQHLTLIVSDLGQVGVLAAVRMLVAGGDDQGFPQRNRLEILHVHRPGQSDHFAELVDFAHGLIQDRGDYAAVGMSGRPLIAARQLELADSLAGLLIDIEFQPHALGIIFAASKAVVLWGFEFQVRRVSMGWLVFCHGDEAKILALSSRIRISRVDTVVVIGLSYVAPVIAQLSHAASLAIDSQMHLTASAAMSRFTAFAISTSPRQQAMDGG